MDKFEAINKARRILGLGEEATKEEIRSKYLELVKKYHPDKTSQDKGHAEKIKDINRAYKIITSYCDNYKFSFSREEIERMNPDLKLNKQFEEDWLIK